MEVPQVVLSDNADERPVLFDPNASYVSRSVPGLIELGVVKKLGTAERFEYQRFGEGADEFVEMSHHITRERSRQWHDPHALC